jgi:hypothetical protein
MRACVRVRECTVACVCVHVWVGARACVSTARKNVAHSGTLRREGVGGRPVLGVPGRRNDTMMALFGCFHKG